MDAPRHSREVTSHASATSSGLRLQLPSFAQLLRSVGRGEEVNDNIISTATAHQHRFLQAHSLSAASTVSPQQASLLICEPLASTKEHSGTTSGNYVLSKSDQVLYPEQDLAKGSRTKRKEAMTCSTPTRHMRDMDGVSRSDSQHRRVAEKQTRRRKGLRHAYRIDKSEVGKSPSRARCSSEYRARDVCFRELCIACDEEDNGLPSTYASKALPCNHLEQSRVLNDRSFATDLQRRLRSSSMRTRPNIFTKIHRPQALSFTAFKTPGHCSEADDYPTPPASSDIDCDSASRSPQSLSSVSHDRTKGLGLLSISVGPERESITPNVSSAAQAAGFSAELDPFHANAGVTCRYLATFFESVNLSEFDILPKYHFLTWATSRAGKSLPDKMMLYSLMAWATLYQSGHDSVVDRTIFKTIVYKQLSILESLCALQTVHSLLFLACTEYGDHQYKAAFDLFERFVDAIARMKLSVEQESRSSGEAYDLSPVATIECYRRTFWAAFCTSVYIRLAHPEFGTFDTSHEFVALPCNNKFYDCCFQTAQPRLKPYDAYFLSTAAQNNDSTCSMSQTIQITQICDDVHAAAVRAEESSGSTHDFEDNRSTRKELDNRLADWSTLYEVVLHADAFVSTGKDVGSISRITSHVRMRKYTGLDMLFHYAHMELNRRIYHHTLSQKEIAAHARTANLHAVDTLRLTRHLLNLGNPSTRAYNLVLRGSFIEAAICEAVEIITAVGRVVDILEPNSQVMSLLYSALDMLEQLDTWWGDGTVKYKLAKERVQTIFRSAQIALNEGKTFFYCSNATVRVLCRDFDLIYATDRKQYLQAAYMINHAIEYEQIHEIKT